VRCTYASIRVSVFPVFSGICCALANARQTAEKSGVSDPLAQKQRENGVRGCVDPPKRGTVCADEGGGVVEKETICIVIFEC